MNPFKKEKQFYFFGRYPEARAIERKIIFHAGPTNSGKTYHALQRFLMSKSGVYCGPLKLLAAEVFNKSNAEVIFFSYCLHFLLQQMTMAS